MNNGFSLNLALQLKQQIETISLSSIILYAQKAYPNECCGFVLDGGIVIPAHNVIESLYDKSLNSKNAFLIDETSWKVASTHSSPIRCIYHSHPNGDAAMSPLDMATLTWTEISYLVVGLIDTRPIVAKLYWWENGLQELDIQL